MNRVKLNPDLFTQKRCEKCGKYIFVCAVGNKTKCPFCKAVHEIEVDVKISLDNRKKS